MTKLPMVLTLAALASVQAAATGFYVCPAPCEAMFLPRDMEGKEDCLCLTHQKLPSLLLLQTEDKTFRCPKDSSAKTLHPKSFADCACSGSLLRDEKTEQCVSELTCNGKYILKTGVKSAQSLADCDCVDPYKKDESTGECYLDHCPRAANYVAKNGTTQVHSLADCDCLPPYTKNAQSGECFLRFECPTHSSSPIQGYAKSLADCTCDWGYIRPQSRGNSTSEPYCIPEKPTFACPMHSRPLMTVHDSPSNFMDCECVDGYERLEKLEICIEAASPSSLRGGSTAAPVVKEFDCPDFSIPLAPHPYSMNQCRCLPGFEPNVLLQTCDWTPNYYVCPEHSFNPYPALPALDFMDCHCAKGYERDDTKGQCIEKAGLNENGCPAGALIEDWPVHDPNWDCFCPHGEVTDNSNIEAIASPDFMLELTGEFPESDWSLRCLPPPIDAFFGCPKNAVMNNWPVLALQDCSCKAGFDSVLAQNELGMVCNRTAGAHELPPCANGMHRSQADNVCRSSAEEVLSSEGSGKIVVNGNELDYILVEEDIMVTQGDVAVGTSFGYLGESGSDLFYILHGYYNKEKESRWKEAKMCFTVDTEIKHRRQAILDAMKHITTNTGFTFLECAEEFCDDHLDDCDDLVDFAPTSASSCWSSIGRVGGRQMVGVSDEATCGQGNLIHVLLHAVGLHHPSVRTDRDSHIQIAWECVESTKRTYFAVEHLEAIYSKEEIDSTNLEVPYDYFSIMHHRADAFVNSSKEGGCMTIFPLIEDPFERQKVMTGMGQRDKMSLTDIHYVWALYPELKEKKQVIAAASLESVVNDALDSKDYHAPRLHTKSDEVNHHTGSSTSSTIGAIVCVTAFIAIVGFAMAEMKRIAKKRAETEGSYADPLLTDPIYD